MQNFGYEVMTTFWEDFSIADHLGLKAVSRSFNRIFKEWKSDHKYLTELIIVLNVKCWKHYNSGREEYSALYSDLYYQARDYAIKHLKGEELRYFINITD